MSLLSCILQSQYHLFVIKRRSVIQRRVVRGAEGREGLKGGMSAAHRTLSIFYVSIFKMASILPMPDTFSLGARVTRKLFSFAKDHPPLPLAHPFRVSHRAAIDCSASERKRQGIHPYALRSSPRAFLHAHAKRALRARTRRVERLFHPNVVYNNFIVRSFLYRKEIREIWKETIELQLK